MPYKSASAVGGQPGLVIQRCQQCVLNVRGMQHAHVEIDGDDSVASSHDRVRVVIVATAVEDAVDMSRNWHLAWD